MTETPRLFVADEMARARDLPAALLSFTTLLTSLYCSRDYFYPHLIPQLIQRAKGIEDNLAYGEILTIFQRAQIMIAARVLEQQPVLDQSHIIRLAQLIEEAILIGQSEEANRPKNARRWKPFENLLDDFDRFCGTSIHRD